MTAYSTWNVFILIYSHDIRYYELVCELVQLHYKQFGMPAGLECWLSHLEKSDYWKIVYDQWYKNRQKTLSFIGHISDSLSVVLVRGEPHKGYVRNWVSAEPIGKLPKLGSRGVENLVFLSDWLCQKAPRRYFTFTFSRLLQSRPSSK